MKKHPETASSDEIELSLRLFGSQFCSRFELDNLLCGNLNRIFGRRIDTYTGSSFRHTEGSETYQ